MNLIYELGKREVILICAYKYSVKHNVICSQSQQYDEEERKIDSKWGPLEKRIVELSDLISGISENWTYFKRYANYDLYESTTLESFTNWATTSSNNGLKSLTFDIHFEVTVYSLSLMKHLSSFLEVRLHLNEKDFV